MSPEGLRFSTSCWQTVLLCSVIISTDMEDKSEQPGTCHTAQKLMLKGFRGLEEDMKKLSSLVLIPILASYEPQQVITLARWACWPVSFMGACRAQEAKRPLWHLWGSPQHIHHPGYYLLWVFLWLFSPCCIQVIK